MKTIFKSISQIGIVVKDLYSVISDYSNKYGIGPWSIYDTSNENNGDIYIKKNNETCNCLIGLCYLNNIGFEIIQPVDKNNIFFEFIKERGEYLHSICYEVDNLSEASNYINNNGLKVLARGSFFKNNFVYFNSQSELNHIIKISENKPNTYKKEKSRFGIEWFTHPKPYEIYPDFEKQNKMNKPVLNEVVQVSFIVKDVDEMMEKYYKYYGVGPWVVYELGPDMVHDMISAGKKKNYKFKLGMAKIGGVEFELVQPMDKESIFYEFLKKYKGGFHHVAYSVDNYNETMNYMDKLDLKIFGGGNLEGKHKFVYLNTDVDLKHIIELNETEPGYEFPHPTYKYP